MGVGVGGTKASRHPGVRVGGGTRGTRCPSKPVPAGSFQRPPPPEPVESAPATPTIKGLVLHTRGPTTGAALADPPKSLTKRHQEENQGAPHLGWGALKTIYPGVGEQAIRTAPAPPFPSRTFRRFLSRPALVPGEPWWEVGDEAGGTGPQFLPARGRLHFEPSSGCSQAHGVTDTAQASVSSQESEAPGGCLAPSRVHTFVGAFSSALEPGNPFSVLSFPEELTRHSFLRGRKERGEAVVRGRAKGWVKLCGRRGRGPGFQPWSLLLAFCMPP